MSADYVRLGTTLDDAIGEAFDKTAKLLGLAYPGGPEVEREAQRGDPERFILPRPMLGRAEADFSLSGLKTALRMEAEKVAPLSDQDVADLCAAFQQAVVDVVTDRLRAGLRLFREKFGGPTALVVAGGVAVNQSIRRALDRVATETGHRAGRAAAGTVHRQWRDDRLGRLRAARARAHRHARRRAARALAARSGDESPEARRVSFRAHRGDRRGRVGHGARQLRGARRTRRDVVGARSAAVAAHDRAHAREPAPARHPARRARRRDRRHRGCRACATPCCSPCRRRTLRAAATALAPQIAQGMPVIACAKGIERGTHRFMTEIIAETLPGRDAGDPVRPELRGRCRARTADRRHARLRR